MEKRYLLLVIAFCSFGYDLMETIGLAKTHDPGYQSEKLSLSSQTYADRIGASGFLPEIDFSIVGTHIATNHQTTSSSGKFKMDISVPIYSPEQISTYKAGLLTKEQALTKLKQLDTDHTIETIIDYFEALKAQSLYTAKKTALQHYQQSLKDAEKKEAAGLGSHVDTLVTQASLDASRFETIVAKNELNQSLNILSNKINRSIDQLNSASSMAIPDLPLEDIESLTEYAQTSGTRIKLAQISVALARNELSEASNHFIPTATIDFEQTQPLDTIQDHFFEQAYSSTKATVTLSVRVFSGFKDTLTVKEKKLSYLSAEAFLDDERYALQLAIKNAYRNYQSASVQANAALSAFKSAQASLKAQQEKHKSGLSSELTLVSAIAQSADAQHNFYTAIYDLSQAYLQVKATTSTLDSQAIQKVNQYLATVSEFEKDASVY